MSRPKNPCFAHFYANYNNDAVVTPSTPTASPFLQIATKYQTSLNNDAALHNICAEPVSLRPAFMLCKGNNERNLQLTVCSRLHYHA
eukprot:6177052-Ditylum_brightwellii.AAC.1